jgi:hypothetical protein
VKQHNMDLVGKEVIVRGLVARPELNGRRGTVAQYLERTGRCAVRVVSPAVLIKPVNLEVADEMTGMRVLLDGTHAFSHDYIHYLANWAGLKDYMPLAPVCKALSSAISDWPLLKHLGAFGRDFQMTRDEEVICQSQTSSTARAARCRSQALLEVRS